MMASLYDPRRRTSPIVSSVEEWWRMGQEGGAVEPTQVRARCQKVRGLRLSGAEPMVIVCRKGRETGPSKPIRGIK